MDLKYPYIGYTHLRNYLSQKCALALIAFIPVLLFFDSSAYSNETEMKFVKAGLVDIKSIDRTIQVDLVNSDPNKNYFRENFYNGLTNAYLQEEVAVRLSKAQKILKSKKSGYSLLILDAARPRSVSRRMYEKMKGTRFEKFVANPQKGSLHNYGVAVDLSVVDAKGDELDMGFTPFRKSIIEIYWQYAKMKIGFNLTDAQIKNRKLLADTMVAAGFIPLSFEWWHFNGMSKHDAIQRYKLIE